MIREFTPADIVGITEICNYYIRTSTATFELEEVSDAQMSRRFLPGFPALVAEVDGRIAGYAYVHPWKERAAYWPTLELTVYIHPDFCGRGLGRELVVNLIERTRSLGRFHSVIACITADNHPSISLFKSLGFTPVSHFPEVGMKFGRLLSVVDLILPLQAGSTS